MLHLGWVAVVALGADVELSWSARVLDGVGTPVEGPASVEVRLFNAASADPAWSETYAVALEGGYFSAVLGADPLNPLDDALLAHRPVEIEVSVADLTQRQTLLDVPFAARAMSVAPGAVTAALSAATCTAATSGAIGFDAATGTLRVCDNGQWATVWTRTGTGAQANPGRSCLQILQDGHSTGSGAYWIDADGPGGAAPLRTHCDMDKDGGGWTLVAYLGSINGSKTATVGAAWYPLFDDFGAVDGDAHTTRSAFSRMDLFPQLMHDDSQFLAYRTTAPTRQMIWPVSDHEAWAQDTLPYVRWLKLTNDGSTYYTRTNLLTVYNRAPRTFTGYDWNAVVLNGNTNCDNCGNSFATGLGHRSMLYWENSDSGYAATQWFHAQPLSLVDSTGAQNSAQDIAVYLREARR